MPEGRNRSLPRHRGLTHTFVFALSVALTSALLAPFLSVNPALLATVTLAAVGSHLLADALNPDGVRPYVLSRPEREYRGPIDASNRRANRLLLAAGLALTLLAVLVALWA